MLCSYLEQESRVRPNPGRQCAGTTRWQLPSPAARTCARGMGGEVGGSLLASLPPIWFGILKLQRLLLAFTGHLPLRYVHHPSIPAALRLGVWVLSQVCKWLLSIQMSLDAQRFKCKHAPWVGWSTKKKNNLKKRKYNPKIQKVDFRLLIPFI